MNHQKKSNVTLTSWIDYIRHYMEERGMDTIFRILKLITDTDTYLLEDWGSARKKTVVTSWIEDLKNGVTIVSTRHILKFLPFDTTIFTI